METTILLAQKGATVYVASRNREKSEAGIKVANERLQGQGGPIRFHQLDLATVQSSVQSAQEFEQIESRLDIVVCNAGISLTYRDQLSEDGYEQVFATNHLGHFAFVTTLLGMSAAAHHLGPSQQG